MTTLRSFASLILICAATLAAACSDAPTAPSALGAGATLDLKPGSGPTDPLPEDEGDGEESEGDGEQTGGSTGEGGDGGTDPDTGYTTVGGRAVPRDSTGGGTFGS